MVEEESRKYDIVILIVLLLLCWPAAIIYYLTRPKVTTRPMRVCLGCGRQIPVDYVVCPHCGRTALPPPTAAPQVCPTCGQPLTFIQQYNRWYCGNCKKYP